MNIQKRSITAGLLLAFALILYGTAKYYSPSIIFYVVEQSLVQKAPSGIDSVQLNKRLRELIAQETNSNKQMKRLLQISAYLEKVQQLTPGDLEKILASETY